MVANFLYIDPGTGSMLFTLAISIATTLFFAFRALVVKLRFILSGGKADKTNASKIPYVIFSDHKRYWNVFKPCFSVRWDFLHPAQGSMYHL